MTNVFFDEMEAALLNLLHRANVVLREAGVPYRVVGGVAVYLYVTNVDEDAGRLTRDLDVAIRREDLSRIAAVAPAHGFEVRHAAGLDMLVDASRPKARSGVHFVFAGEKVRPDYVEPVPEIDDAVEMRGVLLMPLDRLVRMKLTSFRDKDRVHVRDMDEVGLITPAIELQLSATLRERLVHIRATE